MPVDMAGREPPVTRSALVALTLSTAALLACASSDARAQSAESSPAPTELAPPAGIRPPSVPPAAQPAPVDDPFAGKDLTGTPPLPPRDGEPPPKDQAWDDDYDGRRYPTRSEDVLVWIPRGLLLPAHLALEYLVRLPLIGAITAAEEQRVFEHAVDLFTFADGDAAVFPTAFYDSGRGAWAAANMFYNNAWVDGHRLDALAGLGSNGWYQLSVGDQWSLFEDDAGRLRVDAVRANDPTLAFAGVGPRADIDDQVFYSEARTAVAVELAVAFEGLSTLRLSTGLRQSELSGGRRPSISGRGSTFDAAQLPGFGDAYTLASAGLAFELDSRSPERSFTPGSGVRLEGFGSVHLSSDSAEYRFIRYGVRPIVFWDITGVNHVLALSVYAHALHNGGPAALPVHELVAIGGNDHMRGFLLGRFRGQSALVHALAYTWPVLFFADGLLFMELGNAFEGFFERFSYAQLCADAGFGLRTSFSRDFGINLLLAFGTNRLGRWDDDGLDVQNVRFVVGATHAF